MAETRYIGDGVKAESDCGMIRLSTMRENGEHFIFLEPSVFAALERFANYVWKRKEYDKEQEELYADRLIDEEKDERLAPGRGN